MKEKLNKCKLIFPFYIISSIFSLLKSFEKLKHNNNDSQSNLHSFKCNLMEKIEKWILIHLFENYYNSLRVTMKISFIIEVIFGRRRIFQHEWKSNYCIKKFFFHLNSMNFKYLWESDSAFKYVYVSERKLYGYLILTKGEK